MSDSIKDFLLTPITSPQLTDANYAEGINKSFKNINDNFAKLLSTPFLQGADGKDFELYKQNLFTTDNPSTPSSAYLNDWGKSLLYSIYKQDGNSEFNTSLKSILDNIRTLNGFHEALYYISGASTIGGLLSQYGLNQYYPVRDSNTNTLVFADDSLLLMPYVWTYVTRNDKGSVDSQFVAQYYRFLDARLSDVRSSNKNIDYSNLYFDEMSCFLTYDPSEDVVEKFNDVNVFDRIYITPTLRYDRESGDWFWIVDGQETGISAKGIQGDAGTDGARCWYALGKLTQDANETDVNKQLVTLYYFLIADDNTSPSMSTNWAQWKSVDELGDYDIKTGDLVFSLIADSNQDFSNGIPSDLAITDFGMGIVRKTDNGVRMYYNTQYSFKEYISALRPNEVFKHIGCGDPNTPSTEENSAATTRGLWLSVNPQLHNSVNETPVHMIYSDDTEPSTDYKNDLRFRINESLFRKDDINNGNGSSFLARVLFDNYLLNIDKILLQETLSTNSADAVGQLQGILNVYGNSYFVGDINIKAKAPTGSEVNIEGYTDINIEGQNITQGAVDYKVSVADSNTGANDSKYEVIKNQSTVIEDQIMTVESSSYDSNGRATTSQQQGTHIPFLATDYETSNKLISQWTRFGDFCLIDPSITNSNNRDSLLIAGFKYLYGLSGNNVNETTITSPGLRPKFSPSSMGGNWSTSTAGNLRLTSNGKVKWLASGDSFFGGSPNLGSTLYQSNSKDTRSRGTMYTQNIVSDSNTYDLSYAITADKTIAKSNFVGRIDNNRQYIVNAIRDYLKGRIPSGTKLKTFKARLIYKYDMYPHTTLNLGQGGGLYYVNAAIECANVVALSTTQQYKSYSNGQWVSTTYTNNTPSEGTGTPANPFKFGWCYPGVAAGTSVSAVNQTLDQLKGSTSFYSTLIASFDDNQNSTSTSQAFDNIGVSETMKTCAIAPNVKINGTTYNALTMSMAYQKMNDAYANNWKNIITMVGKFNIQFDLANIEVTIQEYSYTDSGSRAKYIICPLGIFSCSLTSNDDYTNSSAYANKIQEAQFAAARVSTGTSINTASTLSMKDVQEYMDSYLQQNGYVTQAALASTYATKNDLTSVSNSIPSEDRIKSLANEQVSSMGFVTSTALDSKLNNWKNSVSVANNSIYSDTSASLGTYNRNLEFK